MRIRTTSTPATPSTPPEPELRLMCPAGSVVHLGSVVGISQWDLLLPKQPVPVGAVVPFFPVGYVVPVGSVAVPSGICCRVPVGSIACPNGLWCGSIMFVTGTYCIEFDVMLYCR